MIINPEFM